MTKHPLLAMLIAKAEDLGLLDKLRRDPEPEPAEAPPPDPEPMARVGVWTGRATLRNPRRDCDAAVAMGITDLHLMVNDHSAQRERMGFHDRPRRGSATASVAAVRRVAEQCERQGLRLHVTTWVMPFEGYLHGLVAYVEEAREVVEQVTGHAPLMVLDAEEPWTQARRHDGHPKCAAQVGGHFRERGWELGLTAIGYFPKPVRPLFEWAQVCMPQTYVTNRSRLRPTGIERVLGRWRRASGQARSRMVPGLAGYKTTPQDMQACLDVTAFKVAAGSTPSEVAYWSLSQLRRSRARAAVVRSIREGA